MSREGAGAKKRDKPPAAGTPIWAWAIYAVGIFAATIFVGSILFTVGGLYLSDAGDAFYGEASAPGFALWGGLMALAAGLWLWRRQRGRR